MMFFLIPITTVGYILFLLSKFTLQVRQQIDRRKKVVKNPPPTYILPSRESMKTSNRKKEKKGKQRFSTLTVILQEFHKFSNGWGRGEPGGNYEGKNGGYHIPLARNRRPASTYLN